VYKFAPDQRVERIPRRFLATTETHDAAEHTSHLTGWRVIYKHVGRRPFRGSISELWLWPMQIMHERLDQPLLYRGTAWKGAIVFVSLFDTRGSVFSGGRELAAPGAAAVTAFPWDFADHGSCSAPSDCILIAVHEEALVAHAEKVLKRAIPLDQLHRGASFSDAETTNEFRRCVTSILGELTRQPSLLDSDAYRVMIQDRVLNMLVRLTAGSLVDAQGLAPPTTRTYVVQKATAYMESHLADRLVFSELCRAIRVCPRTLRYSFEEVVGVSPTQYLQALRMDQVRRELLGASTATQVHCIAERYGFSHMGRFAQGYRRAFGELPSDTRGRAGIKARH